MKKRAFAIVVTLFLALGLLMPLSAGGLSGPEPPAAQTQAVDACGTSPDRSGGPDAFGYTFKDSAEPGGPVYSWVDISTTGTNIPFTDDDYWGPFALGFSFNFYGTDYTNVYASSNGWLSVLAPTSSYLTNDCPMPGTTPPGIIAGIWDDLDYDTGTPYGTGYRQAYAAGTCPWGGYAGACFITEWYGMYHYGSNPPDNMWFEIIVLANGNIVIQFQDASNEAGSGSSTGIQNPGNPPTIALPYACNTAASLSNNLAVEYYYPSSPLLSQSTKTAPATIYTGQDILYTIGLKNSGPVTATLTTMVDPIPVGSVYVPGSVTGGATYNSGLNQIEFTGDILPRSALTVTFLATATATSGNIVNSATISQTQIPAPVVVQATTAATAAPLIVVDPLALESQQATNVVHVLPMTITNDGFANLDWELSELPARNPNAVIYDNGPLVTHPGGGFGGADASALQSALLMNTYGFGHQFVNGYRMADDFTVNAAGGWQIDTITFYAYQTGSGTTSTITGVYLQIWNGPPNGGGSVIWGDLTTNRMASTSFSNIYRVLDTSLTNNQRPIMADVVTVNLLLPPGTYWLDWMTNGTLSSGPWAPPISILGQTTTGNALQYTTAWAPALDTGTNTQQGMPFTVNGTAINCVGDIPWLSEAPISGTIAPAGNQPIAVSFDSTGLADGTYTGNLCVVSNDPTSPLVQVPVTLTVRPPTSVSVTSVAAQSGGLAAVGFAALAAVVLAGAAVLLRKRS